MILYEEIYILRKLTETFTAKYFGKNILNYVVKILKNVHEETHFLLQLQAAKVGLLLRYFSKILIANQQATLWNTYF